MSNVCIEETGLQSVIDLLIIHSHITIECVYLGIRDQN